MARTKQTRTNATPGFAIEIKDDTELGMAILMATHENGRTAPAGVVISINEAREIAENHRLHHTGIVGYDLWAQGLDGEYRRLPFPIA